VKDVKLKMLAIKTEKDFKQRAEVMWLAMRNEMGSGSEDGFHEGKSALPGIVREENPINSSLDGYEKLSTNISEDPNKSISKAPRLFLFFATSQLVPRHSNS
jgi:hypothetical protein